MLVTPEISNKIEALLTDAIVKNFKKQGHTVSNKGIDSIKTIVKSENNNIVIQIFGEEYMGFQDAGRKAGKLPNVGAIIQWVKDKGITDDDGKKTQEQLGWAIAIHMKRIGMHSTKKKLDLSKRNAIQMGINDNSNFLNDLLFKSFEDNFTLYITNFTKNNKNITITA